MVVNSLLVRPFFFGGGGWHCGLPKSIVDRALSAILDASLNCPVGIPTRYTDLFPEPIISIHIGLTFWKWLLQAISVKSPFSIIFPKKQVFQFPSSTWGWFNDTPGLPPESSPNSLLKVVDVSYGVRYVDSLFFLFARIYDLMIDKVTTC